jgi:hypothetical protein
MTGLWHVTVDLSPIGYEIQADSEELALDTAERMLKDELNSALTKNATLTAELIERV